MYTHIHTHTHTHTCQQELSGKSFGSESGLPLDAQRSIEYESVKYKFWSRYIKWSGIWYQMQHVSITKYMNLIYNDCIAKYEVGYPDHQGEEFDILLCAKTISYLIHK